MGLDSQLRLRFIRGWELGGYFAGLCQPRVLVRHMTARRLPLPGLVSIHASFMGHKVCFTRPVQTSRVNLPSLGHHMRLESGPTTGNDRSHRTT
jgi:hypothetical protein